MSRLLDYLGLAMFVGVAIVLACLCVGCSTATLAPTPTLSPAQAFAAAHAGEVCVLTTTYVDGVYVDRGVLVPMSVWVTYPTYVRTMPISYCNPAE